MHSPISKLGTHQEELGGCGREDRGMVTSSSNFIFQGLSAGQPEAVSDSTYP